MRIRRSSDAEGEEVGFNLTPMIDCVFLLNIFYMLTTTFLNLEKEMDLNLPEAKSGRPEQQETKEVIINVMADGRMKVGERFFEQEALVDHLKQVALADASTPVTIRGDRETVFQNAVRAMDACGRANLNRISVGLIDGTSK
ncbi:MAG: biopolymer transporter ExbD [Planctomycetes bacterium]|nr:biopolymer transporter ExbD [Planctomycetota bacterium]